MKPTTEEIERGFVAAKAMIPMNEIPFIFRKFVSDDKIREAVTVILTASGAAPITGA
jgi:hypothetical protein